MIHSSSQSLIHPFTLSYIHSLIPFFIHSFLHSLFCPWFLPSCIPSFTHSFIPTVLQVPWTIVSDVCPEDVKDSHKQLDEALKGYKEVADKDWSARCWNPKKRIFFLTINFVPFAHPRRWTKNLKMIFSKMWNYSFFRGVFSASSR